MPKVLITGMSGTGKSTALQVLGSRGHRTVDTDTDRWSYWVTLPDGSSDWVWREQAITDLHAPRGALSYPQRSWEELEGRFLDPMAYLDAKARGNSSLVRHEAP